MKANLSNASTKKYLLIILFTAPLLFYWVYCMWVNPSQNYYTNDAQFPYFINSLAIFKGGEYKYVDHPGTPVQIIGTALIGLTYPFLSNAPDGFIFYHLKNPDLFFSLAFYFLILTHLACVFTFFSFAQISNRQNTILAAALAVMYFGIHTGSLGASTIWNHNSFSFPFGTLLSLFLFKILQKDTPSQKGVPITSLIALGIGAGILASFTIYMLVWLVGVLSTIGLYYLLKRFSVLKTLVALAITGTSALVGFFLATLPVLNKLGTFFNWVLRILTHKSGYLAVPEQESTFTRLQNNWTNLGNTLPALYAAIIIVLILGVIALFMWGSKAFEKPSSWAMIGGTGLQTAFLLFILLDRPSREAYFLSLAAILPILLLAIMTVYEYNPKLHKILTVGIGILIFAGVVSTTNQSMLTHQKEVSSFAKAQERILNTVNNYAEEENLSSGQVVILWMHGSYSPCWGLRIGNLKAGKVFSSELDIICQNQYQLNNSFRADLPDHSYRLNETDWDIIFTCEKWVRKLSKNYPSAIIESQADINWECGNMVIVYREKTP